MGRKEVPHLEQKRYIGAYGLLIHADAVLLVRKARGPYTGTLDLPGGGIEYGESPAEAVVREFDEETGLAVRVTGVLPPFSLVAGEQHHLGFCFTVELEGRGGLRTEPDGQDSGGALWVPLSELDRWPLSPLARQALGH